VVFHWNEQNLNPSASNNWRASLVPAAAVIPAPKVYTKAVAVKTLVVEFHHLVSSQGMRGHRVLRGIKLSGDSRLLGLWLQGSSNPHSNASFPAGTLHWAPETPPGPTRNGGDGDTTFTLNKLE